MDDPCMKQEPLCKRFSTLAGSIIIFTIWRNIYPFWKYSLTAPSGSGEDFLISSMYFRYFVITSPWKRAGSFIWTNLNSLNPRMHCTKFGWSWPSGSGEEDFLISSMHFRYFVIIENVLHLAMYSLSAFGGWIPPPNQVHS